MSNRSLLSIKSTINIYVILKKAGMYNSFQNHVSKVQKKKVVNEMSFFSKSSSRRPYKNGHHGNKHYQNKGIMSKIFGSIGSGSHSDRHYSHSHSPKHYRNDRNPVPLSHSTILCPNCHKQVPAGSKFCLECGAKVNAELFCLNCGEKLPPNAKFCMKCGTKVNG